MNGSSSAKPPIDPELIPERESEGIRWLYDRINYEKLSVPSDAYPFRLDRMRALIRELGMGDVLASDDPPSAMDRPLVIHLAGTKGKGSVAAMVAGVLTSSGIKTGLYTSPHLHWLGERFQVDGRSIDPDELDDILSAIRPVVERMESGSQLRPTFFELTTAIAWAYFRRQDALVWVLETGLGGRLDSTNVIQSDVTAITSIGLDHQHVLGNTVEEIAREKAGILKRGVPIVCGRLQPGPRAVIHRVADERGCPVTQLDQDFSLASRAQTRWGSELTIRNLTSLQSPMQLSLNLEGPHQAANAALALAIVDQVVVDARINSDGSLAGRVSRDGLAFLAHFEMPARQQRHAVVEGGTVLLDAAHNVDSIAALCATIRARFADDRVMVLFGTSVDKDALSMLRQLNQVTDEVVVTQYLGNPRFYPVDDLRARVAADRDFTGASFRYEPDAERAMTGLLEQCTKRSTIVVSGSFFLAAEMEAMLRRRPVQAAERR